MRQLITIVIAIACLLGVGGVAGYRESDWDNEAEYGRDQASSEEFADEEQDAASDSSDDDEVQDFQQANVVPTTIEAARAVEITHTPGAATTYVRWGRTTCRPGTIALSVGYLAGSHYGHKGGNTNPMCLPEVPVYSYATGTTTSFIYGAEYHTTGANAWGRLRDQNVPCVRCLARGRPTSFMQPGTDLCPTGTLKEYAGYLMGGSIHFNRQEFICVDKDAEAVPHSAKNTDGYLIFNIGLECGFGIPCSSTGYQSRRPLTCVVCTAN